jgi:ubiquinone biosynthesis protein COQ9
MDSFKQRLAQASIKQVPSYGWTQDAITQAAIEDPKLNISMSGLLSPTELVHWLMDDMNKRLRENKKQKEAEGTETDASTSIYNDIKWRLEQVVPLVQSGQWHRGMAIGLSTPVTTRNQLHEFIEIISPPNVSTAYRTALGGTFVATELHLLSDTSPNYEGTWTFLQNRLNELEQHKDDPTQLLLISSSMKNTLDTSIPVMASMAVAQSLVDGLASLVVPSFASSNNNNNNSNNNVMGTKASDYRGSSR